MQAHDLFSFNNITAGKLLPAWFGPTVSSYGNEPFLPVFDLHNATKVFYTPLGHTPAMAGGARELRIFTRREAQFVTGALYNTRQIVRNPVACDQKEASRISHTKSTNQAGSNRP
jgi:hypothetical protein